MSLHITVKGAGCPLVFFHGWGFDHEIWLKIAQKMEKSYQLFLVDLPGFGLSAPMSWEHFKESLLKKIPSPFNLIGWSMGGLFATKLALEEPHRILRLVNIASSPRFIKEQAWPGVDKAAFEQFFIKLAASPKHTLSEFIGLQLKNTNYQYVNQKNPHLTSLKEGLEILKNWDLRKPLYSFKKPTFFLFGRLDAIIPRATLSVMEKNYPQFGYFMFTKAAHMPFLSHPNEFIAVLERSLSCKSIL